MTFSFYNWLRNIDTTSKVEVALYQGTIDPTVGHQLSDFLEGDFPGYARQAFRPYPGSARTAPGMLACSGYLAVWSFAGEGEEANNIGGLFLVATLLGGAQQLVCYEAFRQSIYMNAESLAFGVAPNVIATQFPT